MARSLKTEKGNGSTMNVLLIDNYDSFTYNLYQYLGEVFGELPTVVKNDTQISENRLKSYDAIVISPGPGAPWKVSDFGTCKKIIQSSDKPILGICLGHQGIIDSLGGRVALAETPYHGRTSEIFHQSNGIFENLPNPLEVVRYHSLVAVDPVPDEIRVTALTETGIIMGIEHKYRPIWGVQFHPESIYTEHGRQILRNFKVLAEEHLLKAGIEKSVVVKNRVGEPAAKEKSKTNKLSSWHCRFRMMKCEVSPEAVFDVLFKDSKYSFWLDSSARSNSHGRYSYMGDLSGDCSFWYEYTLNKAIKTIRADGGEEEYSLSLKQFLRNTMAGGISGGESLPFDFCGGIVGYQGYELKSVTENDNNRHVSHLPNSAGIFASSFIAFDHSNSSIYFVAIDRSKKESRKTQSWFSEMKSIISRLEKENYRTPVHDLISNWRKADLLDSVKFDLDDHESQYLSKIDQCKKYITLGESYEICLTNRIRCSLDANPYHLYRVLRSVNPAPRSSYLTTPKYSILSSSPEKFFSVSRSRVVEAKPIKGTRKRGQSQAEDAALYQDLLTSEKDRAENLMITDLLRNDLNKVCEVGSVWAPKLMHIETYSSVHQLVSTVRGRLKSSYTAEDLLFSAFPPGSMTGAPKKRTLEIIDELEATARGVYSGSIGYFSLNGAADLSVAIRTIVVSGRQLEIGVGGAITILSDSNEEYQEILTKGKALMEAIALYATGDKRQFTLASDPNWNLDEDILQTYLSKAQATEAQSKKETLLDIES